MKKVSFTFDSKDYETEESAWARCLADLAETDLTGLDIDGADLDTLELVSVDYTSCWTLAAKIACEVWFTDGRHLYQHVFGNSVTVLQ